MASAAVSSAASVRTFVVDHGSSMIRSGFSGDDSPHSVFPSVVCWSHQESCVGDEAYDRQFRHGRNTFTWPIEKGIVTNWNDMEEIWHHTFKNALRASPENHAILLTEAPFTQKVNREKTLEIMFETFKVPSLCLSLRGVLAMYTAKSGCLTGVSVSSGDSVTNIIPIFEGYALTHAIKQIDEWKGGGGSGREVTDRLMKMLGEREGLRHSFTSRSKTGREVAQDIKEKHGYVALDFESEMKKSLDLISCRYELPDGEFLTTGNEQFRTPEAIFHPLAAGGHTEDGGVGIHHSIVHSIGRCDIDLHRSMFNQIVLSGGNTLFPGYDQRLSYELNKLSPSATPVHVIAQKDRKYASWIGGSIFASLSSFSSACISREEYREVGPQIVHRQCF